MNKRKLRVALLVVLVSTLAALLLRAAPPSTPNFIAKFDGSGNPTSNSIMFDDGNNVGVGTTDPTQRLTLGSGNILLPTPSGGVNGNLYFGGITDVGQVGLRLFGGDIGGEFQSGFIDVRAGTLSDGLRFRVDTFYGGAERMRINAAGNVGINTEDPTQKLDVAGTIRSSSGGFMFPDGTTQTTATLRGLPGPQGIQGPPGPVGPPVKSVAICTSDGGNYCSCSGHQISQVLNQVSCAATSETGTCTGTSTTDYYTEQLQPASCCVCAAQ